MRFIKLFEYFKSKVFQSVEELENYLRKFSIPISSWGTGKSKELRDLYEELVNDECKLIESGESLHRIIEFVGVEVFYKDDEGGIYHLVEDRQEFSDGRVRKRKMLSSVSEKMKFGESPSVAGVRGIKEELNIVVSASQLSNHRDIQFNGSSMSYPGLIAKYKGHQFTCYLNKEQFNADGYVEVQKRKKTFFKWIKSETT